MKKLLALLCVTLCISVASAQERYLDELFPSVSQTVGVQYASNYSFLLGAPMANWPLVTDVYTPTGDNETDRACVIILHTGNFLPRYLNKSPTGSRQDSSIVVASELFAKRGYVAFAADYRMGWDAANVDPVYGADMRRGTLINAVYRALNDVKALVRYIKKSVAEDDNPYGVNPDKIIIYGHGSGGYLSLAYGSLDRIEELENEPTGKWLSTTTTPTGGFVQNELYVNTAVDGGIDGFGGVYNDTNHFGYTNDVIACVNAGGALGDSLWMEAGEAPLVSFHCPNDGFAPFTSGLVIVPTTQEVVVDVVGSRWAIGQANANGNNDAMYGGPYTDGYTVAADAALASNHPDLNLTPGDYKGLFPFNRPNIAWPFQESSPWDWWDETTVVAGAYAVNGADAAAAQAVHDNALSGSPTMSPVQGKAYLDSIQGFLAPRLHHLITFDVGVEETDFLNSNTTVFANNREGYLVVKTQRGILIKNIEIYNMNGSLVKVESGLNTLSHQINGVDNMTTGLYLVKVTTDNGIITRKAFVK